MYTIRGTRRFLQRYGPPATETPASTTLLGEWYANVLFWGPQVAIFVNATTYLPVLAPLKPANTLVDRFPEELDVVLRALGVDAAVVDREIGEMAEVVVATTDSRRVLGVMNEFAFQAEHAVGTGHADPDDLTAMSRWLADTIVGPLTGADRYTPIGALEHLIANRPSQ